MKLCEACGGEITGAGKRFCSISCSNKKRPDRNLPTTRATHICENPNCLNVFEAVPSDKRRFCSHSCSAVVSNRGKNRHSAKVTYCSRSSCTNTTGSRNKKYCSKDCYSRWRIDAWLAGDFDANGKYSIAEWARQYVFERAGWQCQGVDSRTNKRCIENRFKDSGTTVLQVDHIDGNWQNSWPDNLRALCPTCHVLTGTYGAANKGNGRTWKREYNQYKPKTLTEDLQCDTL